MKNIIFLTLSLFSLTTYSQINFYRKIFSENAVELNVGTLNDLGFTSKSIVFDNENIVKLENKYFIVNDNYLKIIEVVKERKPKFLELLKMISEEKDLFLIEQEDLNVEFNPEVDDINMVACTSIVTYYMDITLNDKKVSLKAYALENDCGRSREKLDLFIKYFKLIEDTWNITNTPKGRSLKE